MKSTVHRNLKKYVKVEIPEVTESIKNSEVDLVAMTNFKKLKVSNGEKNELLHIIVIKKSEECDKWKVRRR